MLEACGRGVGHLDGEPAPITPDWRRVASRSAGRRAAAARLNKVLVADGRGAGFCSARGARWRRAMPPTWRRCRRRRRLLRRHRLRLIGRRAPTRPWAFRMGSTRWLGHRGLRPAMARHLPRRGADARQTFARLRRLRIDLIPLFEGLRVAGLRARALLLRRLHLLTSRALRCGSRGLWSVR